MYKLIFSTSALCGFEKSASLLDRFTTGTLWTGRNILSLSGLELRLLSRPAGTQSLYRLRYPGNEENFKKRGKKQL
jgi:hypothetical protein